MKTSEQTDKLWPAVVKTRKSLKGPKKDNTNPAFKSKYADLSACVEAADEASGPQGLVTLQEVTSDTAGVAVSTLVVHESGQWVQSDALFIPANKHDAQGFGSAISYARRYSLKAFWNMADDDDDGNAAADSSRKQQADAKEADDKGYKLAVAMLDGACERLTKDEFRTLFQLVPEDYRARLTAERKVLDGMVKRTKPTADVAA